MPHLAVAETAGPEQDLRLGGSSDDDEQVGIEGHLVDGGVGDIFYGVLRQVRHVVIDPAVSAGMLEHGKHRPELAAVHNRGVFDMADYLFTALNGADVEWPACLGLLEQLAKGQLFVRRFDSFRFFHRVLDADGLPLEIEAVEN